ncbi:MAG: RecX family transcriptional regulator, partial [Anaerolineaceae bacterium]|nr:RecX family transcriptional regulator [Anaerolineaceae bacterium]
IHYRPRSSYEVQAKLVKLGFETPIIESVIEELLEKKYIDDREFAINWVAYRSRSKPRSREMLRYELRKKKISEDTIDDVIATVPGNDELAVQLGKKYLRRYTHCSDKEFKEKMAGVLARRLFPYSVIRTAIIELIKIRNK